ncbi:MAG: hypothetical protein U0325_07410 [Polyangiales bacterium]
MRVVVDDERANLEVWAEAFGRVLGWAPRVLDAPGDPPGIALRFDGPIEPVEMLGSTGHLAQSPALLAHARAMGFDWDAAGVVRTVPSPDTFNRRAARLLPPGAGYRMHYDRSERRNMALGGFLLRYLDGGVPVQLASPAFYRAVLARAGEVTAGELGFHFTSFAHDLSVHALNYQVVPRVLREAIRARVTTALPARVAAWATPEAPGPLTLTTFFDNDVNRFCYAVWTASDAVDEALQVAEAHGAQLLACLDHRIAETVAGTGDVESGDTHDLRPLAPWTFTIGRARPAADAAVTPSRDPARSGRLAAALLGIASLPWEIPGLRARLLAVDLEGPSAVLRVGWEDPVALLVCAPDGAVEVRALHPSAARLEAGLRALAATLPRRITPEALRAARAREGD